MKYKLLHITIVISALFSILILLQGIDFIKVFGIVMFTIIVFPLILFIALKKIAEKYNWKTISTNIITSLLIIFSLFHLLLIQIFFFVLKSGFIFPFSMRPKLPRISEYANEIGVLKRKHGLYDMRHFPDNLPTDATNYYFQIEDAFDGSNTDFVKFNSNEKYINDVLKKYKKDCVIFSTNEDLHKNGTSLSINELSPKDDVCLLHKKNMKEVHTSGFAIKKPNTIIFFYADF